MSANGYDQLLIVQDFDTKLDQLHHRHVHHPLRTEITEAEATRAEQQAAVEEIQAEQHEVDRQRKRVDDEVASVQARRDEIEAKLYDGSVTGTKDLLALQDEAKSLATRQAGMEDDELELMQEIETFQNRIDAANEEVEATQAKIQGFEVDLIAALAEVEVEQQSTTTGRAEAAAEVPEELLKRYEQLREDMGGIAVARLLHNTCQGCHLSLSAVETDRMKNLPDDAVVTCDQCGRILIR